jgi:small-conductance mechanosensitive channel
MKNFLDKVIWQPLEAFLQKLGAFLPSFLGALLVFVVGLFLAWLIKLLVVRLFKLLKLEAVLNRGGIAETLQKMAVKDTPTKIVGRLFYWLVVVIFFIISLNLLQLPAVDQLLEKFLLYLPSVFIAVVILIVGVLLGNFFGRAALIASVNAGIKLSGLLSKSVKTIIILFAFVMALDQLGIGRQTVVAAFTIIFGGVILALALAFGLGGKDIAKKYLERRFSGKEDEEKSDELKHI